MYKIKKKIKLILFALPCFLFIFFAFNNYIFSTSTEKKTENFLNNISHFNYENIDHQKNTVRLRSEKAYKKKDGEYELHNINLIFLEKGINSFDLLSEWGIYNEKNQKLILDKNVSLTYNNGARLSCHDVYVDIMKKNLSSSKPVALRSDSFLLTAGKFELQSDHKVLFTKSPQIIIKHKKN
ncbi:MAG: LPS export ABC transporter periplasmic protein LptC [Candidatus Puniceispirillum sp.]|nr:LPS export ABC transporter periplasmic protein LptC [Candidatus Pelagibacter sp.]MBA4282863.1 LPS export ABC transporter periplasmic protein LptC [Candidatus Puniceispirillum sp.]